MSFARSSGSWWFAVALLAGCGGGGGAGDSTPPIPPALSSQPTSPSSRLDPVLVGYTRPGATVAVYSGAGCTGVALASAHVGVDGAFAVPVTVAAGSTTTFSATASKDGKTSGCGPELTYVVDGTAPVAPANALTTPVSPANANEPVVSGTTEPRARVDVFADAGCSGAALGSATAGADGAFAATARVADDTTTTFFLRLTDFAGNASDCFAGPVYVEDSTPPAAPALAATSPASPANAASVSVSGAAEPLATIVLHAGTCAGGVVGTGAAAADGSFVVPAGVLRNQVNAFVAEARDAAGNASPCSAPVVFVEDSAAPAPPALASTPPNDLPRNAATIRVSGVAEPGGTVTLYRGAACEVELGQAAPDGAGAFALDAPVDRNATTTFTARAADALGNLSGCGAPLAFVEDSIAPATPAASATVPASPSSDLAPVLVGTAEPGATVRVFGDAGCGGAAGVLGSGLAGADGAFAVTVAAPANRATALHLDATDGAGNTSACASGPLYVEDSTPPGAPVLLSTTPPSPANTLVVDVSGTAEPFADVAVFAGACGAGSLAAGKASAAGTFTLGVIVARDATTALVAQVTDAAGNVSGCSAALPFVQDSTLPAAPALASTPPNDHARNLSPGDTIALSGRTEAAATLNVYRGAACDTLVGQAPVAADGTFGLVVAVDPDATTIFTARATDTAGNVSPCGPSLVFVEDSTRPALPLATAILPASPANQNDPVLSGDAEPGATLRVYGDAACAGPLLGDGTVGGTGAYAASFHVGDDTTTEVHVTATDAAGNVSDCAPGPIYVEDSTPPAKPALASVAPASPANTAAVTLDGSAEPDVEVTIFADGCGGAFMGTGKAAGDGSFTISVTVPRNRATSIHAQAKDAAGNPSLCSDALAFVEDSTPPAAPALGSTPPSDHARNLSPGSTIALSGRTEATAILNVYRGAACDTLVGPAPVAADGTFGLVVPVDPNATTTFTARATDPAQNTSACGAPLAFVEDRIAPAAPTFDPASFPNGPTADGGPTFKGTAEASATVQIFTTPTCDPGTLASSAPASATGTFAIPVPVPRNTTTNFGANAVDAAGNASGCTAAPRPYVHDDTPPAFAGIASVTVRDAGSVQLAWQAATDALTPQGQLVYDVCRSTTWGGCTSGFTATPPSVTGGTGTITYDVAGLTPGTRYFFVVRARDALGNTDRNAVQKMGKTYGDGAVATASGSGFTCVLDAGGRVQCLGAAGPQLGNGGGLGPVFGLPPAVGLCAGEGHACAVSQDGGVYCWGANDVAQVGVDPAPPNQTVATATRVSLGLPTPPPAVAVECGRAHTCALLADGSLRCWGKDDQGQLGNGAAASWSLPVAVPPLVDAVDGRLVGAVGVAAGDQHTCAVHVDGSVRCWGARTRGQLGDGIAPSPTAPSALVPVFLPPAPADDRYVAVDAGWAHTCLLTLKGKVSCTGANDLGQLGDGTINDRAAPVVVGLAPAGRIALGRNHSCAVTTSTGQPYCWGDDAAGQMGDRGGPGLIRETPALANVGFTGWKAFFAGHDETCGVRNGGAFCWGTGGTLGGAKPELRPPPGSTAVTALPVNGIEGATALAAGTAHTCAVLADGTVRCFGSNSAGQVGNGQASDVLLPVDVGGGGFAAIVAGPRDTCAGNVSGATCWGSNEFGQLGDGVLGIGGTRPVPSGVPRPFWPVAIGDHACGADGATTVECWGRNDVGQLGRTPGAPTTSSGPVAGGGPIRAVTVGALHACAIDLGGLVTCWGDDARGQLGGSFNFTGASSASAITVYGLQDAVELDAGGGSTTCARDAAGDVWCWGANDRGQLGDPTLLDPYAGTASRVVGLSGAIGLAVGPGHACAVLADGTVRCWGSNASGQLGDGTTSDSAAPVQALGVAGARQVVVGETHTCALLGDGTARCWGGNLSGQLGDGTATARATAAPVEAFP